MNGESVICNLCSLCWNFRQKICNLTDLSDLPSPIFSIISNYPKMSKNFLLGIKSGNSPTLPDYFGRKSVKGFPTPTYPIPTPNRELDHGDTAHPFPPF
jgi:hypothetical protein